jgi:RNA polymerase sigma-70 factor (ECF subfamily)
LKERPDTILVRETKGGDRAAYGELVCRYQDKLYTIVYGLIRNREDALDLTQEVFIKAYVGLGRFSEEATFYTWLYRIAVNACIDFNRRRRRTVEPLTLTDGLLTDLGYEPEDPDPASDPERALAAKELRARLYEAIHAVSEPFRAAVVLRDVEGLTLKEIAAIMNCPLGTVKSRLQRGRYELRQKLAAFVEGVER